jgi:hypothetical protein
VTVIGYVQVPALFVGFAGFVNVLPAVSEREPKDPVIPVVAVVVMLKGVNPDRTAPADLVHVAGETSCISRQDFSYHSS